MQTAMAREDVNDALSVERLFAPTISEEWRFTILDRSDFIYFLCFFLSFVSFSMKIFTRDVWARVGADAIVDGCTTAPYSSATPRTAVRPILGGEEGMVSASHYTGLHVGR